MATFACTECHKVVRQKGARPLDGVCTDCRLARRDGAPVERLLVLPLRSAVDVADNALNWLMGD